MEHCLVSLVGENIVQYFYNVSYVHKQVGAQYANIALVSSSVNANTQYSIIHSALLTVTII